MTLNALNAGSTRRKNVIVTGANGYIGSAVCRAFVRAGWRTFGLVRNPKAAEELSLLEVVPVVGSFTDLGFLDSLLEQVDAFDVIVSCTEKIPGYAAHFEQVMSCVRILANRANDRNVRPLVLWSSGCKDYGTTGLHGTPGLAPHTEDSPLNGPALLRERTENSLKVFDHAHLFDAAIVRPTSVFGYSSSYYGAMFDHAEAQKSQGGGILRVPGDPNSIMHATHVDDCAEAYVLLAEHPDRNAVAGQAFNISGHRYETLQEVAASLANEYGFDRVEHVPASEKDPSAPAGIDIVYSFPQWVGSDKIRSLCGWTDRRALFSEDIHVHRVAYELMKKRGHGNVVEVQRRIGTSFQAKE